DSLAHDAIHCRDACTWIARKLPEDPARAGLPPISATLGPYIYEGTAGLALFLARTHAFSNEATHADAARAAIQHALKHATRSLQTDQGVRFGFYSGALGVAWAAKE